MQPETMKPIDDSRKTVYTADEIASILDISRSSAYQLIRSNQFPVIRIGKCIRIHKKTFDRWLERSYWMMEGEHEGEWLV